MFAYIKNNTIAFLSIEKLKENFLENLSEYSIIEYDNSITSPLLEGGKIVQAPKQETPEEKYARIFEKLVNLPTLDASTDQSVLEGLVFSDKQKGDLIVARVFKDPITGEPNPHFQTALLAKKLLGNNEPEFLQMLQHTQQQTDAILAFFKMGKL